ncbi:unnamed protein product [Rhizophagus irregularis]|nr:unnamed protein product [Rhizophagus irregularis]
MINNRVTYGERLKNKEQCQVPSILLKNNQNNASSSIQHVRDFQKDPDNLEEIVESSTNEENINVFLARQRLRFTKGNLNNQKMKDSMYLDLHIAAHNIDRIASTPSIQKLYSLLEFIEENNIDIMAISETNIDYRQEYFINQDIKLKIYSIIFSEHDQKTKGSGMALVIHNRWMKHYYAVERISPYIIIVKFLFIQREIWI